MQPFSEEDETMVLAPLPIAGVSPQPAEGVPQHAHAELVHLATIADAASAYARQAKAPNTRRAYLADWHDFQEWCSTYGLAALPAAPEAVALYLSANAKRLKVSTLTRRLTAISQRHKEAGFDSPTRSSLVQTTMQGIRREHGSLQHGKMPALVNDIQLMVRALPLTLQGTRDRALLLVGFAGAFRRSELVSFDVADAEFSPAGLTLTLKRSKTDQAGSGRKVGILYGRHLDTCPVRSLLAWLDTAGNMEGPIFRPITRHGQVMPQRLTPDAVATIVKRSAQGVGLDPTRYAGHSLRSGLATSAAAAGLEERAIQNQTGHRSVTMLRRYIREGSLFRDNVTGELGL